jgi:hypothetical protein
VSGWIKIEKALETDPRTNRMVKALAKLWSFSGKTEADGIADKGNAIPLPAVTVVCGALTRLWIHADSHIRQDNSLDMSPTEIDEWLGIPGFCNLMPAEWLVLLDDGRVELPDFLEHNGVEAKRKALGAKRVENHRIRKEVTGCNAPKLPDQTRPDLDQTIYETRESAPRETESEIRVRVSGIKDVYPKAARPDWIGGEHALRMAVETGKGTWDEIYAGVVRYAAYCEATCRLVSNPAKFFADVDRPWTHAWDIPVAKPKPGTAPARNDDAAWAEAKFTAKEIAFREPYPGETITSYARQVKEFKDRPPMVPLAERRGLAGIKQIGAKSSSKANAQ